MNTLLHRLSMLFRGQSIARILMNEAMRGEVVAGKVLDVGGARKPDYYDYFQKRDVVSIEALDGMISGINFETDALPSTDGSYDTVVACNILEHIFNYAFLVSEMHRVLKPGGQLIGFVPFWVGYHGDPHDYFRYTDEALQKILAHAEFTDITIRRVGGGPILANFNTINLSMPRFVRPFAYVVHALLDTVFTWLRPDSKRRNPLGYIFSARKSGSLEPA